MRKTQDRGNIEWYLIGLSALLLFVLGIIGFIRHAAWHSQSITLLDSMYLTLQLIPLNSGALASPVPVELELARFLFPMLAAVTAIKASLQLFRRELRLLKLRWLKNHIIICGLSRKGLLLASHLRTLNENVVIIERDEENKWLATCEEQDMIVLHGDASDPAILLRSGITQARCLVAVVEDDGVNAEIMVVARSLVAERSHGPLVCLAHIADPQLCALLSEQESSLENPLFQMNLFNVFELGARGLILQHPAWSAEQLVSGVTPRILVVGLGRMGENVILQIARDWWNQQSDKTRQLKIILIDRDAVARADSVQARYPQLKQACDLATLEMDVYSAEFERAAFLKDKRGKLCIDHVYICLDDDSLGLHAALTLQRQVPNGKLPIVVRMTEENGLAHLLERQQDGSRKYRNLFAYTYLDHVCRPNLLTDTPRDILARAAHEDYILQNAENKQLPPDDPSVQPWELLDQEYRQSNYQWVDHINSLLRNVDFTIAPLVDWDALSFEFSGAQIEQMAQTEHEHWMQNRLSQGWRYAPGPKDLKQRTNPLLVSWDQLAETEKEKNRSLVRRIPAFLGKAGYQVKFVEQSEKL